jgi:hypothetical protein
VLARFRLPLADASGESDQPLTRTETIGSPREESPSHALRTTASPRLRGSPAAQTGVVRRAIALRGTRSRRAHRWGDRFDGRGPRGRSAASATKRNFANARARRTADTGVAFGRSRRARHRSSAEQDPASLGSDPIARHERSRFGVHGGRVDRQVICVEPVNVANSSRPCGDDDSTPARFLPRWHPWVVPTEPRWRKPSTPTGFEPVISCVKDHWSDVVPSSSIVRMGIGNRSGGRQPTKLRAHRKRAMRPRRTRPRSRRVRRGPARATSRSTRRPVRAATWR